MDSLHKKEKNEPHKYINISLLDRAEIDNKTALELAKFLKLREYYLLRDVRAQFPPEKTTALDV